MAPDKAAICLGPLSQEVVLCQITLHPQNKQPHSSINASADKLYLLTYCHLRHLKGIFPDIHLWHVEKKRETFKLFIYGAAHTPSPIG